MTPAAHKLALELCDTILAEQGSDVIDLSVAKAKRKITVLAADLQAALKEPLKISPWSPWNRSGR